MNSECVCLGGGGYKYPIPYTHRLMSNVISQNHVTLNVGQNVCITVYSYMMSVCWDCRGWQFWSGAPKKQKYHDTNKYIKKSEWPSCLYNQPWCHYEPFLNSRLKIRFSPPFSLFLCLQVFSTSPSIGYLTLAWTLSPNRTLFPLAVFLWILGSWHAHSATHAHSVLARSPSHARALCLAPSCCFNWITAREARCQKYQDVLIKPELCWSSSTKARYGGEGRPLK